MGTDKKSKRKASEDARASWPFVCSVWEVDRQERASKEQCLFRVRWVVDSIGCGVLGPPTVRRRGMVDRWNQDSRRKFPGTDRALALALLVVVVRMMMMEKRNQ